VARSGRAAPARGGDFASRLEKGRETGKTGGVPGALPLGSIAALLAVQGVDDATTGKGRQSPRIRAEELLKSLEGIRDGLLAGILPRRQLENLVARLKEQPHPPADPRLAELLADIELRASVELAKLDAL
jgi:Class II flagellar assembly regulator